MAHDERVQGALILLQALTAAPGQRITATRACELLHCSDAALDGYLELLATLADRRGGGRAVVEREGTTVSMTGDAAHTPPLRLSPGEAAALAHVLDALHVDPALAERVRCALLAPAKSGDAGTSALEEAHETASLIENTRSFGSFYQVLAEAAEDGVRCRIRYRAQAEADGSERIVDPYAIETSAEGTYLVAWNVEKDAERRYRLDRISAVSLTDDSVEPHAWQRSTLRDHLARAGTAVTIEYAAENPEPATWAGASAARTSPSDPQRLRITVPVSTPAWLFDQVLSARGEMVIIEPAEMREQFTTYAMNLLATTNHSE